MDSYRLSITLIFLFSGIVLVATFEQAESNHLPPVLRAFQQNRPENEVTSSRHIRVKRQNGVIIDSIFQIPITTLSAVNNLFKNSVLAFQSWRQGATGPVNQSTGTGAATNYQSSSTSALQYSGGSNNFGASSFNGGNGYYSNNYYRPPRKYQSSAAMRGDLPVKNDGSSYRI